MRAVPITPRQVMFTVCGQCPSLHAEGLILSIFQKMGTKMAVEATLLTEEKQYASFHVTRHTAAMMSVDPGI